jgi:type II secretory ATPase GspE/PulE/Tfp pilus assembly ATPase PilB-like protein
MIKARAPREPPPARLLELSPLSPIPFSADDVDVAAYAELREACLRHGFLPTFRHGLLLNLAMIAPDAAAAIAAIRRLTHQEVRGFAISEADFDRAVAVLEANPAGPERSEAAGLPPGELPRCPESWDCHRRGAREVAADMVRFAHASGASDLLLDEQEEWLDAAIKVDGQKEILAPVEKGAAAPLLKAFKEMAGISTQAANTWQSGAASFALGDGRRADLRIEITPTVHGESLVARLQDRAGQLDRMRRLPFADPAQRRLAEACLARTQGLIVATGPTGHGKTTTLYSCLGHLDRSLLNIRTLEDPVEFIVPWITQIPVGAGTGRSFGEGLKSLLRQAPHVILMGEIRDGAVAQTCLEAVDTGHLILATLHTRDAVGAVSRLLDLGATGRQIAATLLLAIGQRLVRRLCPHCRRPTAPTPAQRQSFERHQLAVPEVLWIPGGCPRCGERGERGVAPIFELFHPPSHDDLADRIGRSGRDAFDERALRARWRELGGSSLAREALRLAADGQISGAEAAKLDGGEGG